MEYLSWKVSRTGRVGTEGRVPLPPPVHNDKMINITIIPKKTGGIINNISYNIITICIYGMSWNHQTFCCFKTDRSF